MSASIRPGMRIPEVPAGKMMGREKANLLIKVCNALLNGSIRRSDSDSFFISDWNLVLQLSSQQLGSSSDWYMGEWNADDADAGLYVPFKVVRVSPSNTISSTQTDGVTVPGHYVCVSGAPNSSEWPTHPLQTGGENAFWVLLQTYPSEVTFCVEGVNQTYFVDAQPKPDEDDE